MEKRILGHKDIKIAPLIFGGNVFGWTINEKTSFEVLDAFWESGFNCIDTANMYSNWVPGNQGGESETILGKWMAKRKNREQIIVATKVGMDMQGEKGLKKDYIVRAVEASLRRLKTDYIDLYQAHQDDEQIPIEETLSAFDILKRQGKVRVVGASNYSAQRLKQSVLVAKEEGLLQYQTLQPYYNLYDRQDYEQELEQVCFDNNISVITYSSLASGFLSGKYRSDLDVSKSPRGEGIKNHYLNAKGFSVLQALDAVAEELKATPAQIALAWILHRPSITAPIVSATSVVQLQDLLKSVEVSLSPSHLQKLDQVSLS